MSRDDIIRMARETGGGLSCIAEPLEHPWKFSESELIRFAALVAAAEREAVIKATIDQGFVGQAYADDFAAAIRARKEKK